MSSRLARSAVYALAGKEGPTRDASGHSIHFCDDRAAQLAVLRSLTHDGGVYSPHRKVTVPTARHTRLEYTPTACWSYCVALFTSTSLINNESGVILNVVSSEYDTMRYTLLTRASTTGTVTENSGAVTAKHNEYNIPKTISIRFRLNGRFIGKVLELL